MIMMSVTKLVCLLEINEGLAISFQKVFFGTEGMMKQELCKISK